MTHVQSVWMWLALHLGVW